MTRLRKNRRSIPSAIGLLLGGAVFSAVLGEGLLRLFSNQLPNEIRQLVAAGSDGSPVFHPYIGHLHKPNAKVLLTRRDFKTVYHTDDYGFRNPSPWPQRAGIVALGDSLTFGYGVADDRAWPQMIGRGWPEVRVVNLGLIGAGPQQYLRVYETFGRKLRPRLLLVGLFPWNDFWDAAIFDRWLKSGSQCNYLAWRDFGRDMGIKCTGSWKSNRTLLAHRSYLYRLVMLARAAAQDLLTMKTETFRFEDGRRMELDVGRFATKVREAQSDRREFHLVLRALQEMDALAKNDGTKVLVLLQPSKEEIYLPLLGESIPDPSAPLREALTRSGIEYLNLTPVFREQAAKGTKLFFEVDGHPNDAGYALIADTVLAYLKPNAAEYGLDTSDEGSPRPLALANESNPES